MLSVVVKTDEGKYATVTIRVKGGDQDITVIG